MAIVGYARVSTIQQDTALQRAAFKRAGVRLVREEKTSAVRQRPVLEALLRELQPGDTLAVYKLDRLARSLVDLLRILGGLEARGIGVRSLTEPLDTSTPAGRLMVQLLGAVAEFERAVIRERCAAGRVEAMARGVRFGRPRGWDLERAVELKASGLSWVQVGQAVGTKKDTLRRTFQRMRSK